MSYHKRDVRNMRVMRARYGWKSRFAKYRANKINSVNAKKKFFMSRKGLLWNTDSPTVKKYFLQYGRGRYAGNNWRKSPILNKWVRVRYNY